MHASFKESLTFYKRVRICCSINSNKSLLQTCSFKIYLFQKSRICDCFCCLLLQRHLYSPSIPNISKIINPGMVSVFSCPLLAKLRPSLETCPSATLWSPMYTLHLVHFQVHLTKASLTVFMPEIKIQLEATTSHQDIHDQLRTSVHSQASFVFTPASYNQHLIIYCTIPELSLLNDLTDISVCKYKLYHFVLVINCLVFVLFSQCDCQFSRTSTPSAEFKRGLGHGN